MSLSREVCLALVVEDIQNGPWTPIHLDHIISANGANSTIRTLLFPGLKMPYAGSSTWPDIMPEKNVSKGTLYFLHDRCIRYYMKKGHNVMYV
jgi:2-polyprenyl-6-methoxyphenol hydroxylase-like FAD-dependent oxidoreductase